MEATDNLVKWKPRTRPVMPLDRFLSTVSIAVQLDVFWLTLQDVQVIGIIRRVAGSSKALNIDLLRAVTLISQAPAATGTSTLKIVKKNTTKTWARLHLGLTASQLFNFNAKELLASFAPFRSPFRLFWSASSTPPVGPCLCTFPRERPSPSAKTYIAREKLKIKHTRTRAS